MKKWDICKPDKEIMRNFMLSGKLSPLTAGVLASRGFTSVEEVNSFFAVENLSDPFLMKDIDKASETINEAIECGSKICIYGDYDCDGIVSTVILYTYLLETGADVSYYIPEREEGYGLNENAVRKIAEDGVELIITVDNGISAINEAEFIYELGMKLVITDHHQPGEIIPRAEAVVDPHQSDCFSPFKKLCGAGVALKLVAALDGGDFTLALEQFGDLAAIATIADVVELTGENRFIVEKGLPLIENTDRPGLLALKKAAGIDGKPINSQSAAFMIAPRINSSGRFGSPKTAVELLICDDEQKAYEIALVLNKLNDERKKTEQIILGEINDEINKNPMLIRERILFFCGKDWHHGVIGIVAARLMESFGKPCFIMSESNGEIRGSARSFDEFSIFKALQYASETLEKFGGHKGAGGFTVKNGKTADFRDALLRYAFENHKQMPVMSYKADYSVLPQELTVDNVKDLKKLEPFGAGNESPLFAIENASIENIIPLSKGIHTKLTLNCVGVKLDVLIFRASPQELSVSKGDICNFIVSFDVNYYNNTESISAIVKDYRRIDIHNKSERIFNALNAFESFRRDEELPVNYYKSMLPLRDEVKEIYLKINKSGVSIDSIFSLLSNTNINYCKLLVSIDALAELKLIYADYACSKAVKLDVKGKVNLDSAPVLISLNKKVNIN
ncbi:MAG: single-stranded-DNA-specific exonuclease RecJ [Ruminococcus sp.]|nr:single-stranded-DNA-specific exonuclease RecJ [Ruminococcus sp.]